MTFSEGSLDSRIVKLNDLDGILGTRLKSRLIGALLSIITIASLMVPVVAQGGVSATITVQLNFYYLCVCSLTNVRVVLSDQTGRVVATTVSADGSQVLLVFRTQTPLYWLAVYASGYGSFAYQKPYSVYGSIFITVQNYGQQMNYYYGTILLRRGV